MTATNFTYNDFKKIYPDDNACLHKIFMLRYGHLKECPKCKQPVAWRKIKTRRCYQCRHCYEQYYPTAGTVFHNVRRPLTEYFYIMFLFTTTRHGVAAKEIERQLGLYYKTAFAMCHVIRKLMDKLGEEKLKGFVEADETYFSHGKKDGFRGKTPGTQSPVFGMVERMGNVKAFALDDVKKDKIFPLIEKHIDKEANLSTDENPVYTNVNPQLGIQHGVVKHYTKQYRIGHISTNTIEGFFSQLKRMVYGAHVHISRKYLQAYVGECVFRYNYRKKQHEMFEAILNHLPLA